MNISMTTLLRNHRIIALALIVIAVLAVFIINKYDIRLYTNPDIGLDAPVETAAETPAETPAHQSQSMSPPDPSNPMQQIQFLRAQLDQNPNDEVALMALGNANLMIKRFDDAVPYFEHLLTVNPQQLDARSNLASIKLERGNVEDARGLLEKNLEFSPDDATTLFNLGVVYTELKDYQQAIKTWEHWVALNPDSPYVGNITREIETLKAKSGS